ncbi:uncharacterized protein LOC107605842 [Arachis ipaensis]|uniref:uncharacterized protein LOC107605842 n=1 Tax=Arachis ipaensis TaxID=130454 RepID=UPI0007AEEAC6|nr:uncharacterized protein LOC107605842 [Arachis ipaensis]
MRHRARPERRQGKAEENATTCDNGRNPFHRSILEVRLPKHFDKPTDMRYDGTRDPQEHFTAFEARMSLEGVGDEVRVTQKSGEPTRKYLDRFNDECLEIDEMTDAVASLCLTSGLLNEDFRKHLTMKLVWTMQEIQSVAREYINDEEHGGGERQKEHARDGGPSKTSRPFPRVGKFTNYTPLTAPIIEVYQQIAEKRILSKPRPLKDRTGRNKSLYCDHHKGYGHKTPDCFDLKDALEQAIRDEKLAEFSHLIRKLRRRDRDREGEDKTHAAKRHDEPEDNEHGFTIVNVVTARNAAPRSKLAHKKDAKVLAISSSSARGSKRLPPISFGTEDQWFDEVVKNPPMVITARVGTGLIKRILVDTGLTRISCSATCSMPWVYEMPI